MKSHDIARLLNHLADVLYAGPDIPLEDLRATHRRTNRPQETEHLAVNISTLASLSRVDKQQWIAFIFDFKLPIDVRPRDASRDLLGKILKYLEEHPTEQARIRQGTTGKLDSGSPELLKALSFLIKDDER